MARLFREMRVGLVLFTTIQVAALAEDGAAWAKLSYTKWPQIVLTNDAKFKGHTSLQGASGFLVVDDDSGKLTAVTAVHLLGENGGVDPQISLGELDACWDSWVMFPRTKPELAVTLKGSATRADISKRNDILLLEVAKAPSGITPLKVRFLPVSAGEQVHLIGVSYGDPGVSQKVYTGKVTGRNKNSRFKFDIRPLVDLRGFSGAPIVDDDGKVVGVMTLWFEPRMEGELYTEAGGQDAAAIIMIGKDDSN